jgi:Zn-finger nucleic acid-binding protein
MLCPICQQPLLIVELEGVELDVCPDCRGIWFDAQELRQLFELAGALDNAGDLESELERLPHAPARRACPRCRGRLRPAKTPVAAGQLILDQCPRGHGLWFDDGELQTLLETLLDETSDSLNRVRRFLGKFASAADAATTQDAANSQ